jgi:outer membrane protein assembly factor BamB
MPIKLKSNRNLLVLGLYLWMSCALASSGLSAEDWPMWRYDAQRSAATPHAVPQQLAPLWQRHFTPRQQAWDDPLNLDLMSYDRTFEPIVLDGRMFVGFNDLDKLLALDAATGQELWTFYAEAPVRLPPVGWKDRIYFCSDDGFLYCVEARTGQLLWKFSGAPNAQHVIGNRRLTSAWPARGGPVMRDGTLYFAASIWPFMGTFIYALDADTGKVQWLNDRTGAQYIKQPHSAPSFAGVAPQGALVATDDQLIVPGGRSVPAVFDRATGEMQYFELNAGGKGTGGSFVAADEQFFYVHTRGKGTRAFNLGDGVKTAFMPNEPVLAGGIVYSAEEVEGQPRVRAYAADESLLWEIAADGRGDLILAGDMLLAAGAEAITAIRLPQSERSAEIVFALPVEGTVERLLVADSKLFAVTLEGQLLAFADPAASGGVPTTSAAVANGELKQLHFEATDQQVVDSLLASTVADGYAFWYGNSDSGVARALAARSPFVQLAVVDNDPARVAESRRELERAGIAGVTVHRSEPAQFRAPHYVGQMLFVAPELSRSVDADTLASLYQSVRPYGGVLHMLLDDPHDQAATAKLVERVSALNLEQAHIDVLPGSVCVRRVGPLPGSADWTHQYGDVANTLKSNDSRVKLPLGILWFGGSSNSDVLPRHGHGPPEQVVAGRLYIQGMNSLSCRDVYTGRVLWMREFDDLGTFDVYFDATYEDVPLDPKYNQVHIPGANGRGTNYVVTEDRVYLLVGATCLVLDPLSGETLQRIEMPVDENGSQPEWGYIGVVDDVLLGGQGFAQYRSRHQLEFEGDKELSVSKAGFGSKSLDRAGSAGLIGFDRFTGQPLWQVAAHHSFWHNGIVAGNGKVFCLDKNPSHIEEALRRRGKPLPDSYRILALDVRTGKPQWEVQEGVFGTWLGYSEQLDLLLQAGAQASDRLTTEIGRGMTVYRGSDGGVQWKNDTLAYSGPCILHNDLIITNANSYSESAGAFYLQTGKQRLVKNPLTGQIQPWKITRAYGCNNIIASENMLTFRSGAAGFYDLLNEGGTGNLGGFKSGCTSNLVVANGVLNAPDYTRTCSCSYQNQTSLALVHMPDVDVWTVEPTVATLQADQTLRQLAINFGAPGDRRQADGQLWLEYPAVAGDSAPLEIKLNPDAKFFQHHSALVGDVPRPWVLASGVDNVTELEVGLKFAAPFNLSNGLPVEHPDDDAEEDEKGEVSLSSSDLELVEDGGVQTVGVRFNGINVARGAKIRSAFLQFTCDEPSSEATNLLITVEQAANAARFQATSHDVSSRQKSTSEVAWQPKPWEKTGDSGAEQQSPDLAKLIQEVIDRADWKPGNSMAFLISGKGKRVATAAKGPTADAPRLIVDADLVDVDEMVANRKPSRYDVRLHFAVPLLGTGGRRVFDVYAQDQLVASDVTLDPLGSQQEQFSEKLLADLPLSGKLRLKFVPKVGQPLLSGIELIKKDETR